MTPEEITQKKALAKAQVQQIIALMDSIVAIQKELPKADYEDLEKQLNEVVGSYEPR